MASSESASFQDHFQDLNDPRVERTCKYLLINIGVRQSSEQKVGLSF